MKTVFLSVCERRSRGDSFCDYGFSFQELVKKASAEYKRLSDHDKALVESIWVNEYKLVIPDFYEITTAKNFVNALCFNDIESPQFDGWFKDEAIVRQLKIA